MPGCRGPTFVPRASTALLVSLAVHAVLVGVMNVWDPAPTEPVAVATVPLEIVPPPLPPAVEVEPIAIQFVTVPVLATDPVPTTAAKSTTPARTRRRGKPDATAAISTGATTAGGAEP